MRIRAKFVSLFEPKVPEIVERYRLQYQKPDGTWTSIHNGNAEEKYTALCKAQTLDEVDAVIGNQSWTRYMCDGCYTQSREIIFIGDQEHKGYCKTCIAEAFDLFSTPPNAAQTTLSGIEGDPR